MCKEKPKVLDSKLYANNVMVWYLRNVLYDKETWNSPYNRRNKVILGRYLSQFLRDLGFWWQADRILNHLHLWLKKSKSDGVFYAAEGGDTLRVRRRRRVSP